MELRKKKLPNTDRSSAFGLRQKTAYKIKTDKKKILYICLFNFIFIDHRKNCQRPRTCNKERWHLDEILSIIDKISSETLSLKFYCLLYIKHLTLRHGLKEFLKLALEKLKMFVVSDIRKKFKNIYSIMMFDKAKIRFVFHVKICELGGDFSLRNYGLDS